MNDESPTHITTILAALGSGDSRAATDLLALVYDELRKLAAARLASEPRTATLQPTALVHDVYLRLLGDGSASGFGWASRRHFFAAAAESMRRILIDRARERGALKRGGHWRRLELDPSALTLDEVPSEVLDLDQALAALGAHAPRAAELVKLRFFTGLSHQEAALVMGISTNTADRDWAFAKAWLFRYLAGAEGSAGQPAP